MSENKNTAESSVLNRARMVIVLVAVMWSTSGLFAKAPWLQAWPIEVRGTLLAFWRTLFAGLFLLPLVRKPSWTWRLIPATLTFAFMNVTYLNSITHTTAANAIWLQNTAPFWVVLFSVLFQQTKISGSEAGMLALGMSGVAFILYFELTSAGTGRQGMIWGVVAGISFAAVVITVRWLRDQDAAWVIVLNHLVTAALLVPFVAKTGIYPNGRETLWLICFGVLQLGLPYVIFARSLKHVPNYEASFIVLLEPLLVPFWVFLAYRNHTLYEAPAWWTWVGATFILSGLILRYARAANR